MNNNNCVQAGTRSHHSTTTTAEATRRGEPSSATSYHWRNTVSPIWMAAAMMVNSFGIGPLGCAFSRRGTTCALVRARDDRQVLLLLHEWNTERECNQQQYPPPHPAMAPKSTMFKDTIVQHRHHRRTNAGALVAVLFPVPMPPPPSRLLSLHQHHDEASAISFAFSISSLLLLLLFPKCRELFRANALSHSPL